MKARLALLLGATASLGATIAQASSGDLAREWEGYEPPALFRSLVSTRPVGEGKTVASPSDAEFQAQVSRLREAKSRWEEALLAPAPEGAFYRPDASRLEALRPATTDAALAKKALGDGFPLETVEILALLRSLKVAAKERELHAVLEGYSQVENLDSILRRYATFTAGLMVGVGGQENPDALSWKFPFPGVLALKGEVVAQEARAAREDLEAARRDAVTAARKAYWEILYLQSAMEITGHRIDLLESLKSATSARYAAGETTFQDVVRVAIEREKTQEELVTLGAELHHVHAELSEILNLSEPEQLGAAATREPNRAVPDPDQLYPLAREKRQELRATKATIGKMERMLEMSETMVYPQFTLGLSTYERDEVGRIGASGMGGGKESFPTSTSASMGEGLPKMPWFGKDNAYLRETRWRIEAMKSELQMSEASTDLAVHEALYRLDKAKREEALLGDRVLTLSRAALEAARRGYSAGKVMFSDLMESYAGWFEANLGRERARADAGIARADLEAAVGTTALGGR